jgi:hypothetical protein
MLTLFKTRGFVLHALLCVAPDDFGAHLLLEWFEAIAF